MLVPVLVFGQDSHWQYVNFPFFRVEANMIGYEDTTSNVAYVYGDFIPIADTVSQIVNCNVVMTMFNGAQFADIGHFGNKINSVVRFQNNIYAGGVFQCVNGNDSIQYLARYNGQSWESVGTINSEVTAIAADSTYLYISGSFTSINGQPVRGFARFDGNQWDTIPAGGFGHDSWVQKMLFYHGELYVGGILYLNNDIYDHYGLRVLRNGQWQPISDDQYIGSAVVRNMKVWHDKLYIAGDFFYFSNALNEALVRWDGQHLSAPWPDFYDYFDQVGLGSTVTRLVTTSDHLYVGGGTGYIGNVHVNQVAAYDGNKWCAMYTEGLHEAVHAMFSYNDTLYARLALNPNSLNDYPSGFYKWVGGTDFEACTDATGLQPAKQRRTVQVYPNPSHNFALILNPRSQPAKISLTDLTGKEVLSGVHINPGSNKRIDISHLARGMYIVQVRFADGGVASGKIVKE